MLHEKFSSCCSRICTALLCIKSSMNKCVSSIESERVTCLDNTSIFFQRLAGIFFSGLSNPFQSNKAYFYRFLTEGAPVGIQEQVVEILRNLLASSDFDKNVFLDTFYSKYMPQLMTVIEKGCDKWDPISPSIPSYTLFSPVPRSSSNMHGQAFCLWGNLGVEFARDLCLQVLDYLIKPF